MKIPTRDIDQWCEEVEHYLDEDAVYDSRKKKLETLLAAAETKDTDLSQEAAGQANDVLAGGEESNFELVNKQEESAISQETSEELGELSPMTLEMAIAHCREKAKELGCTDCAREHEQLANWLEELKQYKDAEGAEPAGEFGETDSLNGAICMTTPLFLRMLEYAREDAESDLDLHYAAENVLRLAADPGILGMDDYAEIIDIYEDDDDEEDEDDDDDDDSVDEAKKKKKKKKYKNVNTNYIGRWARYFPRIPWIVPCGILPPPPKPPTPPKPDDSGNVEDVTPPDAGDVPAGDVGGNAGGDIPAGDAQAAPIGESKISDALNQIDVETLKKFIVTEFGPKFSSQEDITSGKDKQADSVKIKQLASASDIAKADDSDGKSMLMFVKFTVDKKAEWLAVVLFDSVERKFSRTKFVNPSFEIFQTNKDAQSEAAAAFSAAFPEIYSIKEF